MSAPVGLVAVGTPTLLHRLMQHGTGELVGDLAMAANAESRWPIQQQADIPGGVRIVAGRAVAGLGRRMLDWQRHLGSNVVMTVEADLALVDGDRCAGNGG
jgi:hypothetical protein